MSENVCVDVKERYIGCAGGVWVWWWGSFQKEATCLKCHFESSISFLNGRFYSKRKHFVFQIYKQIKYNILLVADACKSNKNKNHIPETKEEPKIYISLIL